MKLSKAQQEVVDKMREGVIITEGHSHFHWHLRRSIDPLSNAIDFTNRSTVVALLKRQIVEKVSGKVTHYRLTEQYKTHPDEK